MYTGIVPPVLSYAAMTWAHKMEQPNIIAELETLTRLAINTMVKITRSTPNKGLELILDIMPLHLHVLKKGSAAYTRLHPTAPLHWESIPTNLTNSVSQLHLWD